MNVSITNVEKYIVNGGISWSQNNLWFKVFEWYQTVLWSLHAYLQRETEFCLLCCLADSYYSQSLAIIVRLLYYNNVYCFSCYYCLMSDKKQLKGRGFISVQVSGEIVHNGQKAWKQNQLRCGHRRLAFQILLNQSTCQILVDQKAEKGNARIQQLPPPF